MLVACRGHDRANISSQSLLAAQRGLDLLGVIKMSLQQRSRALKSGLELSILGIRDQHLAGGVNHLLVIVHLMVNVFLVKGFAAQAAQLLVFSGGSRVQRFAGGAGGRLHAQLLAQIVDRVLQFGVIINHLLGKLLHLIILGFLQCSFAVAISIWSAAVTTPTICGSVMLAPPPFSACAKAAALNSDIAAIVAAATNFLTFINPILLSENDTQLVRENTSFWIRPNAAKLAQASGRCLGRIFRGIRPGLSSQNSMHSVARP